MELSEEARARKGLQIAMIGIPEDQGSSFFRIRDGAWQYSGFRSMSIGRKREWLSAQIAACAKIGPLELGPNVSEMGALSKSWAPVQSRGKHHEPRLRLWVSGLL